MICTIMAYMYDLTLCMVLYENARCACSVIVQFMYILRGVTYILCTAEVSLYDFTDLTHTHEISVQYLYMLLYR